MQLLEMQLDHVEKLWTDICRPFRAIRRRLGVTINGLSSHKGCNEEQEHDASPPIRASNGDEGHSARPKVPESNVNNNHSAAPPATPSEGGAEDKDPFAILLKSLVSAAISQQNDIQPTDRPESSQLQGRASEVNSVRAINPLKVPEIPRVQPPTRQATTELDIDKTNQANPSRLFLLQQPDSLFPVWGSTPQGLGSTNKSPREFAKGTHHLSVTMMKTQSLETYSRMPSRSG